MWVWNAAAAQDPGRGAIAFGVLPALANPAATGPAVRKSQRHLAQWQLQPIVALLAEEAAAKLSQPVAFDVMRPRAGVRRRRVDAGAVAAVKALAEAKEAGVDAEKALHPVDWGQGDAA